MIKKALYTVSFSALLGSTLLAQSNLNQEVIAVGERELQVKEVYKQAFFPTEEDTVVRKKESEYQIDPVLYKTKYVPDTIVPANLRILEPLKSLNRFYAKAGLGLYTTSMADVYYNSLRNRKSGLAIAFNHRASKGGIDSLPNNGAFSDNKVAVLGRLMGRKAKLDGGLEFQSMGRNVIQPLYNDANLSNRNRESEVSHEFIRAHANVVKLQRKRKDLGLELNTKLNYTRFYDESELGFLIGAGGSKKMGNEIFGAKVSADYNKFGNDPANASTIIKISPQVETNTEQFYVKAGLSIQGNLLDNKSNFSFFPNIEARAILADNKFTPYASFTGNYLRNNLSNILTTNPYLYDIQSLKNSREKINLLIGARTKLGKNASFDLSYRFQNTDDHLFFAQALLSTGENNGVYTLIYDNLKASTVSLEFSAIASKKLEVLSSFQYHSYTTANITEAYYLPNIESKLIAKYSVQKKLLINLGLSFVGERTAGESLVSTGGDSEPLIDIRTPIESKLKAYADLGIGFEYRYNRRLSAFVNFNNVLSAKYQQFNPYQAQRFGVLGGLSYTF
jgi:hypothetical protein